MATVNRKVIDLYHLNVVTNLQAVKDAGVVGVIHKATEGTTFKDSKYAARKRGFLELGMLWGAYHFLHPNNIQAQLDLFLSVTGEDDSMLYALDWELSTTGTAPAEQASQFLQGLEQRTGRKGVLYSGNVAKEQISGADAFLGQHRLWLAQYGNNPTVQVSWSTYWLWQYSDGIVGPAPQGCPGVDSKCDTSSWAGTDDELRLQWSGTGKIPVPVPPGPTVSISTTGQVSIIVNGVKV